MNRQQIRNYVRLLIDELTEAPEGAFTDIQINDVINISQQNVLMDLAVHIPWAIRKPLLISIQIDKRTYSMTDLSVTDFLMMNGIFENTSGENPKELLYLEQDQLTDFNVKVGEKGDPKYWGYESPDTIFFEPTPSFSYTSKFKAFYIPAIPDLNDDSVHTPPTKYAIPALPKPTHHLISYDVVKQLHIATEEESADIDRLYLELLNKTIFTLSQGQGVTTRRRPHIIESIKR